MDIELCAWSKIALMGIMNGCQECLMGARPWAKQLLRMISFNPHNNPVREALLLPHFTDEETEVCPRSPAMMTWSLAWNLGLQSKASVCFLWQKTIRSDQISRSVMSDSLRPHESQHARPPVHHQLPEFTQTQSIESVMPSSHLILCHPLLLLPPIPPSYRKI